ncbi:MAG: DUF86 domain-containing protein [Parasporobacterium sp.]|nr:DUF86 domain-containing protein [Parasporobacterium sp.]
MDNKDKEILLKIIKHCKRVMEYTGSYNDMIHFEENPMCVEATVFNLMQIGELAKFSLSVELKKQITSIPWNQLYGMRNRIVHGYDGVNMQIVWDTVKKDIPELCDELESIVS